MSDGPGYMVTAKTIMDASVRKSDRNSVIEECARVATNLIVCLHCGSDVTEKVAAAIRALKDKK